MFRLDEKCVFSPVGTEPPALRRRTGSGSIDQFRRNNVNKPKNNLRSFGCGSQ
jgi:hypothetical protein